MTGCIWTNMGKRTLKKSLVLAGEGDRIWGRSFLPAPVKSLFCRLLGKAEQQVQLRLCSYALNYLTSSINPMARSSSFLLLRAPLAKAVTLYITQWLAGIVLARGLLFGKDCTKALITYLSCFYMHWFISISFFNSEANIVFLHM